MNTIWLLETGHKVFRNWIIGPEHVEMIRRAMPDVKLDMDPRGGLRPGYKVFLSGNLSKLRRVA
jgi:hypothetical protein